MVSITLDDTNIQHKSKDDKIQIASFTDPGSPQRNTCFHHFRYVVIVLGGFVMGWMLLFRFTISMAMISMINKTAIYIKEHPNSTIENYFPPEYVELGEFDWNNEIQQIIMTGYMIAYALPQFFTTRMSIKYGLRTSIPVSLSICSISTILTPYMSYWGWEWVLALRLLNGLGASAILPSMISAIEIWMPSGESAIGLALFQFVSGVINAMIPLISGFLTAHHWKWAFHVPGILGLVLCAIWWIVVADNPASSKYISQSEIDLINEIDYNIDEAAASGKKCGKVVQRSDLPWYFVFKIKSFYFLSLALILLDTTVNGFIFILPAYINRVLKVPVEDIGFLNFTVQIGAMFCMLWPTPMTQFLQKKFKMSLTAARNVITFICASIVVFTFAYLALYHDNLIIVITLNRFFHVTNDVVIMSTILSQFAGEGLSGLVYSVMNAIGNLSVLFFCWAVGRVLDYAGESLESWSWVMASMATMTIVYFFNFALFCPSKPVRVIHS